MSTEIEAFLAGYIDSYLISASLEVPPELKAPLDGAVSEAVALHEGQNAVYCQRVWEWLASQGKLAPLHVLLEDGKKGSMTRASLALLPSRLAAVLSGLREVCAMYGEYCPGPYRDSVLVDALVEDILPSLESFAASATAGLNLSLSAEEVSSQDNVSDDVSELGDASVSDGMGEYKGRASSGSSRKMMHRQAQVITRLQTELAKAKEALHRTSQVDVTLLNTKLRGAEADLTRARQRNLDLRDRVQTLERHLYDALTPGSGGEGGEGDDFVDAVEELAPMPEFLRRARRNAKSNTITTTGKKEGGNGVRVSISDEAPAVGEAAQAPSTLPAGGKNKEKGAAGDEERPWTAVVRALDVSAAGKRAVQESVQRALAVSARTNADVLRRLEEELELVHKRVAAAEAAVAEASDEAEADLTGIEEEVPKKRVSVFADPASGSKTDVQREVEVRVVEKVVVQQLAAKPVPTMVTSQVDMALSFALGVLVAILMVLVTVQLGLVETVWQPMEKQLTDWLRIHYDIEL
jgi:hypothetical protein